VRNLGGLIYAAWTLLSWSRVVTETCRTYMFYVFLRIHHVSSCRVHFNVAESVQHRV